MGPLWDVFETSQWDVSIGTKKGRNETNFLFEICMENHLRRLNKKNKCMKSKNNVVALPSRCVLYVWDVGPLWDDSETSECYTGTLAFNLIFTFKWFCDHLLIFAIFFQMYFNRF
jgi:hypothetical protein